MPDPKEASFWPNSPSAQHTAPASASKSAETPQDDGCHYEEMITSAHIQVDSANALIPTDHGHQNQSTPIVNAAADDSTPPTVIDPSDSEFNPDLGTESEMSDSMPVFEGNDEVEESTVDGSDQLAPAQTHYRGISEPSSEEFWKDRELPKLGDLPDLPESAAGRGHNWFIQKRLFLSSPSGADDDIDIDLVDNIYPNRIITISRPGFSIEGGGINPHMDELYINAPAGVGLGDLSTFLWETMERNLTS